MRVDGEDNCHYFFDKHLFYVLFVQPTFVQVAGGSNFSADKMGLINFNLPGYHKIHYLDID